MPKSLAAALLVSLVAGGCGDTSPRLVAGTLPSPTALARENAIVVRSHGDEILNLDLQPDNRLKVIHMRGWPRDVLADETLAVPSDVAARVRRMLWRVRPSDGASAANSIPLGCPYVTDTVPEMEVIFARNGPEYELEFFSLPSRRYCRSPAATEARQLLGRVLRALPRSTVADTFPRGP